MLDDLFICNDEIVHSLKGFNIGPSYKLEPVLVDSMENIIDRNGTSGKLEPACGYEISKLIFMLHGLFICHDEIVH